ncbi:MAG: M81 family metallopeptidase [Candidatus Aminicenantes bacterium]|nr:M81 family metallopeptidase [Candidatus Aminicenantes bacterium]
MRDVREKMKPRTNLVLATIILSLGMAISYSPSKSAEAKASIRIAVATFSHETCTFCPTPTGIAEWEYYGPPLRGDEVLKTSGYIRGFADAAREYDGVELIGITSPRDAKGGSSGSWVTKEAFDKYTSGMVEDLKRAGRLDGVYIALHGAMAVSGIPKPEAEIVRRLRQAVGRTPIFITLDLHANEDHELSDAADAVFIIKRYPHYDVALQGERAARIMIRTIRGTYKPVMATRKPGIITPSVFQGTDMSPAMDIMERARKWEERTKDAYVSVAFGFAYADVPDVGATVMVVTNNDRKLADQIADDMSSYIWRIRERFAGRKLPKTKEGVALAIAAAREGKKPVVIADHSDRTGNSTHILEELVRQGAKNFCITTLADERAVAEIASKAKVDDTITVSIGGYADPFSGNPVKITGKVDFLGTYGRFDKVVVLRFGDNNRVILTPLLHEATDTGIFPPLGINLADLDIIVLKSRVHFRRGYYENGLAGAIFEVDAPGLGPADLSTIPYKNIPKDIYPLTQK